MSTSGSKSNEHVAHFLVDIHIRARRSAAAAYEVSKETARRIHMKKDAIEIKKRKEIILRSRRTHPLYRNMLTSMECRSIQSL